MCVKIEDRAQFVATLDERLTCPICKNVFDEPWQASCGHRFCKKCLDGSFRYVSAFISKSPLYGNFFRLKTQNPVNPYCRSEILRCPIDEEEWQREGFFRDKCCEREVLSLPCFCRYKNRGCNWKGELRYLKVLYRFWDFRSFSLNRNWTFRALGHFHATRFSN